MKKISLLIVIFFYECVDAKSVKTNIIVENCKACHNLNDHKTKKIPSLNDLEKAQFIKLMINYKNIKSDGVMYRISKVLSDEDINKLAEEIYDKK